MALSIPGLPIPPPATETPVLAWNGREFAPTTAPSLVSLALSGVITAASAVITGALALGSLTVAGQITSTLATGTAPLVIASTTVVANLNASALGGKTWASPDPIGTGTPTAATFTTINGTSVTLSGLTSGFLPLIGTAGLITFSTNLSYTSGTPLIQIGADTNVNSATLALNSIAGQNRSLVYYTAGVLRWGMRTSGTAEGGSDTGSNLILTAYDDAGNIIDAPISIARVAAGAMTLTRTTILPNGSASTPSLVFSSITTTGLYRAAASIGFSAAGTSIGTWGASGLTVAALTNGRVPVTGVSSLIGDFSTFTYTAGSGISVDGITIANGKNIVLDTSTGTMLGAAANQKLGLWGVTPIIQYTTTGTTAGFTTNVATNIKSDSTFTGNTGSAAYTVGDIVRALKLTGIMAA